MTTQTHGEPRRRRAAIIGVGLDGPLRPHRISTGEECLLIGGSEQTHAHLLETMLRLEAELERLDASLGDLDPLQLAELAWRIDSPELHEIALALEEGLDRDGRSFEELSADELTAMAARRSA